MDPTSSINITSKLECVSDLIGTPIKLRVHCNGCDISMNRKFECTSDSISWVAPF